MTMTGSCGCSTETCGCCEGTQAWTPVSTANRPGLAALRYRAGTHGTFLETMKARLATMTVDAPGADGQTIESFRPLAGLTTRDASDPAIALLDAWASVADIVTFYQERIANEGYLRTATERRSILELARLVGYALRPGVAATVYLAYALDDNQLDPVEIPAGARAQSIPGPGELPQMFETSEKLLARKQWNDLQVRRQRPQDIRLKNALTLDTIYLAGTTTNLKTGDLLLLMFEGEGEGEGDGESTEEKEAPPISVLRTVAAVEAQPADDRTALTLQPLRPDLLAAVNALAEFVGRARRFVGNDTPEEHLVSDAEEFLRGAYLGVIDPASWLTSFEHNGSTSLSQPVKGFYDEFKVALATPVTGNGTSPDITDPSQFIPLLLKDPVPQARSGLDVTRSTKSSLRWGSDAHPQLLLQFAPRLQDSLYTAIGNAQLNAATSELLGVFSFAVAAPLFGASAGKQAKYSTTPPRGQLLPPDEWDPWPIAEDEDEDAAMFLDKSYEAILPDSFVLVQQGSTIVAQGGDIGSRRVHHVEAVETVQRAEYGLSGSCTRLVLADEWWAHPEKRSQEGQLTRDPATLRSVLVRAASVRHELAQEPITEPLATDAIEDRDIELGGLYDELTSGRWVILSGERADIPGVSGIRASELLMISEVFHGYDAHRAGDPTHTALRLATPSAHRYKRETLSIHANVVKATHGDTREETLGSGAGSQALQSFELKQPPLTHVPAPTPAGVSSTLDVFVNDVRWHETDTLAGAAATDHSFVTKTDDASRTTVIFGDGESGSRLPTGVENVKAVYRSGIGRPGNVLAEQVSMLVSRPLGVKSVINPLRASGGADREDRDQARENTPIGVMALDRLVSLRDYGDFTRTFAGIAKADARQLTDGVRRVVHLTIAGANDIPIDPASDLYRNLLAALRAAGDPDVPLRVQSRELIAAVLSATIELAPDQQWEPVVQRVRAAVYDAFGFARRALGQPLLLCEVIALIQDVPGVSWVDVDTFGGLPERSTGRDKKRHFTTPDELALAAAEIVKPPDSEDPASVPIVPDYLDVGVAGFEDGDFRAAQLAIFTPAVPDTLILNQRT
jgi:predicted phage baseplate assembly protein